MMNLCDHIRERAVTPRAICEPENAFYAHWVALATAYSEILRKLDQDARLGERYEPTVSPAQIATLAVAQNYACFGCGTPMDMCIVPLDGSSGDEMRVARLYIEDSHVFANCVLVHDKCLSKSCLGHLPDNKAEFVRHMLRQPELRLLFASDCNVLTGSRFTEANIYAVTRHMANVPFSKQEPPPRPAKKAVTAPPPETP